MGAAVYGRRRWMRDAGHPAAAGQQGVTVRTVLDRLDAGHGQWFDGPVARIALEVAPDAVWLSRREDDLAVRATFRRRRGIIFDF